MMSLQRIRTLFGVLPLVMLGLVPAWAQVTSPSPSPADAGSTPESIAQPAPSAVVLRVRVLLTKDHPALEIITDRPVVPAIHKLNDPSRLAIDLPNSSMSLEHKEIPINTEQLGALHLDEEKGAGQSVHMVMDLRQPLAYTWETAGNRLTVRLQPAEQGTASSPAAPAPSASQPAAQPATVASLTPGIQPGLVPVTPGGFGAVIFAGNRVTPGSTITAGSDTAVLSLGKNGEVHLCPRTTVSVTTSANGHDLMLGMSSGSLETHYNLDASINSVLTPDFRILLAGPGIFEYAISADTHGNTCVSALPGNTRSAIVSELMGTQSYELKPAEQVMFHSGHLSAADNNIPGSCGCPAPVPVMRASTAAGPVIPYSKVSDSVQLAQNGDPQNSAPSARPQIEATQNGPEASAPPPTKPNDIQAQVEAPLIFRASDLPPVKSTAAPAKAQNLPAASDQPQAHGQVALPPSRITIITTEKPHHGFMGKVKGFFKTIFS